MKKSYLLFVFFLMLSTILTAQTVTCPSCRGAGGYTTMAGFAKCLQCMGRGTIADPNYVNQKAANHGYGMGLGMRGQVELSKGNYNEAFNALKEAVLEYNNVEALFYFGACLELGMGTATSTELAEQAYSIGGEQNDINCRDALKRIREQGFWEADEDTRQAFCRLVKINLDAESAAWSNIETPRSSERRRSSETKGTCSYCNGTKYELRSYMHSASADSHHNSAGTTCIYCGKLSDHYHYRCHYCD